MDVAHQTGADAVGHGATGKGNDQVRFELTYMALDPTLEIVSPWKDPQFLAEAERPRDAPSTTRVKHRIPITQSKEKIYSPGSQPVAHLARGRRDRGSRAGAELERVYTITRPVSQAPDKPEYVEIEFKRGQPGRGEREAFAKAGHELIATLNDVGGRHGVGQVTARREPPGRA